ncbi:MAG: hypothetical protein EA364_00335 [Balneolaceae bacterium]|nr:MAG: hypothetical protein EA364_00335 [Balneolaceae bacterium]
MWAPTPQTDNRHVSRFGRLNGISGLNEPRRLEIAPYTAANILRAPDPGNGNPYYNRNQFSGSLGGDIRYGLTSDFTLTATINPDFGQVEADPAMINLTANENFFSERRPFFIEGSDIFRFGDTRTFSRYGNPATFYSRRIGRSPQGSPGRAGLEADFTNMPDQTTIATAVKVSGKTASGWSVGILDAITLQEKALFTTPSGSEQSVAVEPATNYLVTRAKKDFNSGSTYIGGFASAVNRRIGGTYFENFLRSSAYTAGGDFEHYFLKRNWVASGTISWTTINGTPEAMQLAQRSPVRYYNRVDSGRLSIDPDRTSLSGYATEMSIQKRGGEDRWLGSLTYAEASPGYETNDLGFQNRADYRAVNGGVVYRNTRPEKVQYYEYWLFSAHTWNFDGDRINKNIGTGGFIRFKNMWHANYNMNYNGRQFSDRISRGGPLVELPVNGNMNMNISSNPNKSLAYNAGTFMRRDTEGGYNRNFWAGFRVQPTPWLQFSFAPELMLQRNMYQYIATVADAAASQTFGRRYVFSEIDQTTLLGNFRLNWTFSPSMSLQTYVRPYISTGRYRNFKELQAPGTRRFAVYGRDTGTISRANGRYTVEPDGSGESAFSFNAPDFNFRSIQGNAVFRWEYTRGSTIFLVWQQQRSDLAHDGGFNPGRDLGELFRTRPTNVFLVKVSYWFGS